jgi:hypothetical protein
MVRVTWQGLNGQTYSVAIDATVRQQHSAPSTVTDHPVETGANIADHIRPEADTLQIEGIISNAPIFLPEDHIGGAREQTIEVRAHVDELDNRSTVRGAEHTIGDVLPLPGALARIGIGVVDTANIGRDVPARDLSANVRGYSVEFDRVQACYDEFRRLRDDRVLCRVITKLRVYEDMGITMFDVPRDDQTGDALRFTLEFKHVRFGSTKNEPLPLIPVKKDAKGTASKEEHEGGEQQSALRKAWKFLFEQGHHEDGEHE